MASTGTFPTVLVHYDGTDRGPIYLKDISLRNQLGGGRGNYVKGQDQYIDYLSDATLIRTSDVMLSCSVLGPDTTGVIRSNMRVGATPLGFGSFTVELVDGTRGILI